MCTYGVLHEVLTQINRCPVTEPTPRSLAFVSIAFDPVYAIVSAECEPDLLVYCLYQLIVDRYLTYLKLHLFWEFTRVKIGVAYIKVTVGCDGRRLILKTLVP